MRPNDIAKYTPLFQAHAFPDIPKCQALRPVFVPVRLSYSQNAKREGVNTWACFRGMEGLAFAVYVGATILARLLESALNPFPH